MREVGVRLARAGRLEIDDLLHAARDAVERPLPVRLDRHFVAPIEQLLRQLRQLLLQGRLPAGEAHEPRAVARDPVEDLGAAHLGAAVERVRAIAVLAPQVAAGEADEHAGLSRVRRFPLDALENLRDPHAASLPARPVMRNAPS